MAFLRYAILHIVPMLALGSLTVQESYRSAKDGGNGPRMADTARPRYRGGGGSEEQIDRFGATCETNDITGRWGMSSELTGQISMIPVDIRLAKMLVLGALFKCLDPGEFAC